MPRGSNSSRNYIQLHIEPFTYKQSALYYIVIVESAGRCPGFQLYDSIDNRAIPIATKCYGV